MTHSPEPWTIKPWECCDPDDDSPEMMIYDANGEALWCDAVDGPSDDDKERIVACVNELAGVSDAVLKSGAVKKLLDELLSMPVKVTGRFPEALMLEAFLNEVKQKEKPDETP